MNAMYDLVPVRKVGEYRAGEVAVCRNREDGGLYTVLRIRDRTAKLLFVAADAEMRERHGEFCFSFLHDEGDALVVAVPHILQRKMVDFAGSAYPDVQGKVEFCLRLVRACLISGIPFWLLYLSLTNENIHMYANGAVAFDLFIDLDTVNPKKTERDCARRCGALIHKLLNALTEKEKRCSNAFRIVQMMERNDSYSTLLQLHHDLYAVLKNPARDPFFKRLLDRGKHHTAFILNALRLTAAALALAIAFLLLKSFLMSDISIPDLHYKGLEQIGEIRLKEQKSQVEGRFG